MLFVVTGGRKGFRINHRKFQILSLINFLTIASKIWDFTLVGKSTYHSILTVSSSIFKIILSQKEYTI